MSITVLITSCSTFHSSMMYIYFSDRLSFVYFCVYGTNIAGDRANIKQTYT